MASCKKISLQQPKMDLLVESSQIDKAVNTYHSEWDSKSRGRKYQPDSWEVDKAIKCDNHCRFCGFLTEDINNSINSCPKMSAKYYLPMTHVVVTRTFHYEIRWKDNNEDKALSIHSVVDFITSHNKNEHWWNVTNKTSIKWRHNKRWMIKQSHGKENAQAKREYLRWTIE